LFTQSACQDTCFVTTNHKYKSSADAFIVHGRDYVSPGNHTDKPWIFHSHENPAYTPVMRDELEMSKFTYSSTARLDSDFPIPVWWGLNITGGRGPDTQRAVVSFKDRNTVPIYVASSNCEPVRTEYQKQLMEFIDIDSYGECLRNKYDLTKRYEKNFFADAFELQRQYKFTLVFMNADCELWVDTRLLYALEAGSVPIFMGTEEVDRFLPGMEDSIIKVSDFKTPEDLASYIEKVAADEELYNSYLHWKSRGVEYKGTEMEAVSSNMANWYCNICDKVRLNSEAHPGRVKAEQCSMRKTQDWLPTPKHFNPELSSEKSDAESGITGVSGRLFSGNQIRQYSSGSAQVRKQVEQSGFIERTKYDCISWAVCTTIFEVSDAVQDACQRLSTFCLVIVADKKTPSEYSVKGGCTFIYL
jgi:hypothetical protein